MSNTESDTQSAQTSAPTESEPRSPVKLLMWMVLLLAAVIALGSLNH